ncbi:MAG TPA: ABC transporter permease subunit [Actinocrinis sp.]|nr:ABC transporter permease subunit [Actinocrinis sp.]
MTDLLLPVAPRVLTRAGRHPGRVVLGYVARKASRSGLLWGLVFGFFVVAQTIAYTSAYQTQSSRDQMARAFGSNVGINALIGPARSINTVAGYTSWRELGILSLLGSIWGLMTSTRLLRGEEEAGRYELFLAGQTTRRGAHGQAVAGLGAGLLALFAGTTLGTVLTGRISSVGFPISHCLYFSLTLVASAALFLAVGALTSQLGDTRRRAATMAGAVFGVCYTLRMVADSGPGLHWLVWLSPLGWIEQSRPLTDPNPAALLPVLALIITLTALTVRSAATRDLAVATLPERDHARPHLTLLAGPIGLAVRLTRSTALAWVLAVGAFSVLLGTVAESSTEDTSGNTAIEQTLGRLGGHGSLVQEYLGLTFLILALILTLTAAGQVTAIRAEEGDGRLDNLLVRPVSRASWFAGRLGLSALLLVATGVLAGLGSWAGAPSQHSVAGFGSLLAAGLNVVPPALFLLGLGALGLGAWPRRASAVVYGYLAWSFLVEFTGAVVHADHWLMDTSVFFHMVPAPATSPDWTGAAVITGLGLVGALVGGILLNRRDLITA